MDEARSLAARICRQPPDVLRMTKRLMREAQPGSFEAIMEMSASMQALAHTSADHQEALAAFFEKRPPQFRGQDRFAPTCRNAPNSLFWGHEVHMAEVKIRKLPDWVVAHHKRAAERAGRSLEEELRQFLTEKALAKREQLWKRLPKPVTQSASVMGC